MQPIILQDHVDGEKVDENEVGAEDGVHKPGHPRQIRVAKGVQEHHHPGHQAREGAVPEAQPAGFFLALVELFHQQAEDCPLSGTDTPSPALNQVQAPHEQVEPAKGRKTCFFLHGCVSPYFVVELTQKLLSSIILLKI